MQKPHASMVSAIGALMLAGTAAQADLTAESCTAIANLDYPHTRIHLAEFLTGDAAMVGDTQYPDHCRVVAYAEERVGVDGKNYATGIEVRMPVEWNDRMFFQGGGGIDGSLRAAVGTNTRGNPNTLTLGYAVVSTDGGHDLGKRSDASFGADLKAVIDYGYNSIELAAMFGKVAIREAYGKHAAYSYYLGASNGGRQGLQFAQRHPNLFDGIIAGTPIYKQTYGHLMTVWSRVVLKDIAPTDDQGRPLLSKAYSDADIDLIKADITTQCDHLDGLKDGVVDSAKLCAYDISGLVCDGEKADDCVSKAQANAFTSLHEGAKNSKGEALHPGFPYDPGMDFRLWNLGDSEEWPNNGRRARNQSHKWVWRQPAEPELDSWNEFDFDDLKRVDNASQYLNASSPDMDAFAFKGGKLILYHSMGDAGVSAIDTTKYYNEVRDRYGVEYADEFSRFYLLPGLGHGRLGIGPHKFPALDAMVAWVEEGVAPNMEISGGTPERTRPMCHYPTNVMWDASSESWGCQ